MYAFWFSANYIYSHCLLLDHILQERAPISISMTQLQIGAKDIYKSVFNM